MNFLDAYNLSINPTFRARVQAAIVYAAKQVNGEAPSDPVNEERDSKRKQLAIAIIDRSQSYIDEFAMLLATNATINTTYGASGEAAIPNGDIEFVVSEVFDDAAGV